MLLKASIGKRTNIQKHTTKREGLRGDDTFPVLLDDKEASLWVGGLRFRQAHLSVATWPARHLVRAVSVLLGFRLLPLWYSHSNSEIGFVHRSEVISLGCPDISTQRGTGFLRTKSCLNYAQIPRCGIRRPYEDAVFSTGTETPLCIQGDLQPFTT